MRAMEIISFLIDFILHIDKHLEAFVATYGMWVYGLLFLIVFVETGLVVMPFLPGDSLLFIVGALQHFAHLWRFFQRLGGFFLLR